MTGTTTEATAVKAVPGRRQPNQAPNHKPPAQRRDHDWLNVTDLLPVAAATAAACSGGGYGLATRPMAAPLLHRLTTSAAACRFRRGLPVGHLQISKMDS